MTNLMRVNPQHVTTRDQGVRLLTVGVAGPALLWAGWKYPGTVKSKIALMAVGAALIYVNYGMFVAPGGTGAADGGNFDGPHPVA